MHARYSTKHIISVAIAFLLLFSIVPLGYASTVEIRYMRNDEILGTAQTTAYDSISLYSDVALTTVYFGIRVWIVHADTSTTEVTSGTPVAVASGSTSGLKSATWACPLTSLVSTDKIRVNVYTGLTGSPINLQQTFETEQLGASSLDSATWTVYYYLKRIGTSPHYDYEFWYGQSTYNSCIGNFTWTPSVSKTWHDVSTWTASLATRTWSSGTSWTENLQTRIWNWNPTVVIDSYNESNYEPIHGTLLIYALHPSSTAVSSAYGQSFTMLSIDHIITSCKFYLKKFGSPTGMGHAVLYAHQGTYGTNSTPTGEALATSNDFDVSTLTTSPQLITFTFNSTQQYQMLASIYYCIDFENPTSGTIDSSNFIVICMCRDTNNHSGNSFSYHNSTFFFGATYYDSIFYVYGTPLFNFNLLTRQYLTVASWVFDFGTRIWVDAATWTYNLVTMAWESIAWIFSLGTSIWKDIATWAANLSSMMWRDLTWLFYLLPPIPEWVNVAVWFFSLRSPEWMLVALWDFQLGAAGVIAFLFIAILLLVVIVAGVIAVAYRRPKR